MILKLFAKVRKTQEPKLWVSWNKGLHSNYKMRFDQRKIDIRGTNSPQPDMIWVSFCLMCFDGIYMSTQGYLCYRDPQWGYNKFYFSTWGDLRLFFLFFGFFRFDCIHMSTQEYLCYEITKGVTTKFALQHKMIWISFCLLCFDCIFMSTQGYLWDSWRGYNKEDFKRFS